MLTIRSTINIAGQTVPQIIPVVQGDTGRSILFTLADFTIPQGSTATYYVQKPSGEAVYNAATIDGNTVLVELTAQSIIERGDNYGQVRIENDGEVVTSFDFILLVKPFRGIDATQSTTEMNIFDKAVEQAEEAIDEAKVAALEEIAEAGSGNIADEFASTNSYLAGEYTIYQAKLYRFTSNHTGAWTGSDAEEVTVGEELTDVKDGLTASNEDIIRIGYGEEPLNLVKNSYVKNTDGTFATYNGWSRTNYIYVGNAKVISIDSTVQSEYNCFYNGSRQYIRFFVVRSGSNTIYLPDNVEYIALSNTNAGMANTVVRVIETRNDADIDTLDTFINDISENISTNVLQLYPKVETSKGITLTVTKDTIKLQGTSTGTVYFYDFCNLSKLVGTITFGATVLSGTSSLTLQIPIGSSVWNNTTVTFASAPTTGQIIIGSGVTINCEFRLWANRGFALLDYEPNEITKVPVSALEDAEYNSGNMVYKLPDIADTAYRSELYYGASDGILHFNGTLTGGFTLNLPSVVLTGYNTVNIEVIGGSYTGSLYLYLPTGATAFLTDLSASTQRFEYFDGTEKTVSIYAPSGTTFSNFRFRIWITQGLFNKPYDATGYCLPVQNVVACSAGDYDSPTYARIDDGVLYNVFGNKYSACKNGLLSRTDTDTIAKFALLADLHYTDSEAFFTRIYKKISSTHNVDFCMMLGDVIDSGYYHKPTQYQQQMTQFKNSIKYLGCPNFPFNGNHDDDVNEFAHHGVIDYGIVRFIYFWADYDGTSEGGKVRAPELTWLEQQLSESTAQINILMCHYSISTDEGFSYQLDADSRSAITALAGTYNVLLYLNGHEHDHNVSVGTAGDMTDINLPNGKYAYCICMIDSNGDFNLVVYKSDDDTVLKTINVSLLP